MKLRDIETPVTAVSGIGPATAKTFAKCNIFTVADLLTFYPRDWEDRTRHVPIASFAAAPKVHTVAQVEAHEWFGYGRMKTLKLLITDGTARAVLVCFNRPFLEKTFPVGSIIAVTAPFTVKYGSIQSSSFEADCIAKAGNLADYAGIPVPGSKVFSMYSLTSGLTQAQVRKAIGKALKEYGRGISNELPESLIKKYGLMEKRQAVATIHQPETLAQALLARKTLIFEELFFFQLAIVRRFLARKGRLPELSLETSNPLESVCFHTPEHPDSGSNSGETPVPAEAAGSSNDADFEHTLSPRQKSLFSSLPFNLTAGQKQAVRDCNTDIDLMYASDAAENAAAIMSRLLQGDVGSGKTLVAFFACLRVIDWGGQCAFLAPTELLARQHADNAAKLLEGTCSIRLAFLTGNIKSANRKPLLAALKDGSIDIIIGTHALFSQSVVYHNLKLAVIDEQHRFGVLQRNAIIAKGRTSTAAATTSNPASSCSAKTRQQTEVCPANPGTTPGTATPSTSPSSSTASFCEAKTSPNPGTPPGTATPSTTAAVTNNPASSCSTKTRQQTGVCPANPGTATPSTSPSCNTASFCSAKTRQQTGVCPAVPGLLMLSATPIPRTLALTVFGDLDISYIRSMPGGRLPIQTFLTRRGNEARVYEAVRAELRAGHQAYFVYPRIESAEAAADVSPDDAMSATTDEPLKSAEDMFTFLSEQVYPEYTCALVHSRVDEEEQHRILEEFRQGNIHVLVATSVVEVGVDVPNATCMVIEHAERFGLAALHQLRGRVGRSNLQSRCFLIYGNKLTETGKARLKVLHESTDGFYIAEQDMMLRGPGEVSGIQQSGYLTLGIADPIRDKDMLIQARDEAIRSLQNSLPG